MKIRGLFKRHDSDLVVDRVSKNELMWEFVSGVPRESLYSESERMSKTLQLDHYTCATVLITVLNSYGVTGERVIGYTSDLINFVYHGRFSAVSLSHIHKIFPISAALGVSLRHTLAMIAMNSRSGMSFEDSVDKARDDLYEDYRSRS